MFLIMVTWHTPASQLSQSGTTLPLSIRITGALLLLLLDGAVAAMLEWRAHQAWHHHEAYLTEHKRHMETKRMLQFLSHEGLSCGLNYLFMSCVFMVCLYE